jgi:hypothetical protein
MRSITVKPPVGFQDQLLSRLVSGRSAEKFFCGLRKVVPFGHILSDNPERRAFQIMIMTGRQRLRSCAADHDPSGRRGVVDGSLPAAEHLHPSDKKNATRRLRKIELANLF